MLSFYGMFVCLIFVNGEVFVLLFVFEIKMLFVWFFVMFVVIVFMFILDINLMLM